jgi:hypothetical protein
MRYTDDDITVIVLSNNESQADFIADALAAICLNKPVALPYAHKKMLPGTISAKLSGKYMMQLTRPPYMAVFPIEFIKVNDALYIHPGSGPDIQLIPESANKFYFANGTDQQIEFETDNNNNSTRVWHIAWGIKRELRKIE